MRILIFGGTRFLGVSLVQAALSAGHEVTLFNRGISNPSLFPEVEKITGDREIGDYDGLEGRTWDAALDIPTDQPSWVQSATSVLRDSVQHYTFISSISVYRDLGKTGLTEDAHLCACPEDQISSPQNYGPRKALCENISHQAFPGRCLIVRPGLIVGPNDPSDRFTYWPRRLSQDGPVLAPGDGSSQTQFIDVRDLASWIIRIVEQGRTGIYNATGPKQSLRMKDFLQQCIETTEANCYLHWTSQSDLEKLGVAPWMDLPAYVPSEMKGMLSVDVRKALDAGLTFRPLKDTIRDTLAWDQARPMNTKYAAGLDPNREIDILADLLGRT